MAVETQTPERPMLTLAEVADYLRLGRTRVHEMASRGELPGVVRIGRCVRVHAPTFDAWLAASIDAGGREPRGKGAGNDRPAA